MTKTATATGPKRSAGLTVSATAAPRRSVARGIAGWLLLAATVALLWPAPLGGILGLTVVSGQSMEPTYHTGDLVITVRKASYDVGDIVAYVVPAGEVGVGGRVIHRITRVDEGRYTTQGDNNAEADAWSFEGGDASGDAVAVLPGVGKLWSPEVLPILIAAAVGGIVTIMLWPSKPEEADENGETDDEAADA